MIKRRDVGQHHGRSQNARPLTLRLLQSVTRRARFCRPFTAGQINKSELAHADSAWEMGGKVEQQLADRHVHIKCIIMIFVSS